MCPSLQHHAYSHESFTNVLLGRAKQHVYVSSMEEPDLCFPVIDFLVGFSGYGTQN